MTGSSHAGKSTLIRELQERATLPTHYVSIDETIEEIDLPANELWERGLPAAYSRAIETAAALLHDGALVLFESTFTYVPPDNRPGQFHREEIERLLEVADREDADVLIVHLRASVDDLVERRNASQRLNMEILIETFMLHADHTLPAEKTIFLDTSRHAVKEAADLIWREAARRQFGLV